MSLSRALVLRLLLAVCLAVWLAVWLGAATGAHAQTPAAKEPGGETAAAEVTVGEITYARGAVSAQRSGEPPRFLLQGDAIGRGEVISTSARGFAQIGLNDGTRMTLRPNTRFAVTEFSQRKGEENLAMQLLRGGLRTITGLISKSGPDRMRLQTTTATIGVRGTEFDARLCDSDCQVEQRTTQAAPASPPAAPPALSQEAVVARVAVLSGTAVAIAASGTPRALAIDAALFNGDNVRTAAGSHAVLAFRDRSVITVRAASELRIEDVRIRPQQPEQESFVVRLITGGLRALTGQIAARSPRAVRFQTTTATIGVRGTGLDLQVAEHCIGQSCTEGATFGQVWSGTIVFLIDADEFAVATGQAGVFNPGVKQVQLLKLLPQFFTTDTEPRPDGIKIDFDRLFALTTFNEAPSGLYVGVRDGNVTVFGPEGAIDLGPFESGFLGDGSVRPVRFENLPAFLFNDPLPTPDIPGSKVRVLLLMNLGSEAGSTACEVR